MAETAIVLIAQQPTADTTTLSNDTLHLYFSNELVKYITAICIETIKQYKRFHITVYFKRYVPLFIALFLLFADMAFQIGGISFGNTLLALLTVFYILFLIAFLYVRHHKEQKSLIQERDNLAEAYKLLVDASHTLVSVHNNMNNHVTILNDLMKKNSLALSQAAGISADATALSGIHAEDASSPSVIVPSDTFQLLEQTHQNVIQYLNSITQDVALMEDRIDTGNQVIDSIVNIKIVQAKNQGITIKSEIFIPVGVKVDNYTMTIVLGTLFDAAIEELSQARNKNLHFFMKFDMGHVLVCLIHADELGPEKRKKNRFVYRDDFKLKEAKRAAEKHHGTLRVRVAEENVEAFAQICAHQGNTD
jgi:hypothetical protein